MGFVFSPLMLIALFCFLILLLFCCILKIVRSRLDRKLIAAVCCCFMFIPGFILPFLSLRLTSAASQLSNCFFLFLLCFVIIVIAKIACEGLILYSYYSAANFINKVSVMGYKQDCTLKSSQCLLDAFYGVHVQMVGRLVHYQQVNIRVQKLGQP